MSALLWIGGAVALAGLGLLGLLVRRALALRGAALPPEELTRRLARLQALNTGAVALAFLGLGLMLLGGILSG